MKRHKLLAAALLVASSVGAQWRQADPPAQAGSGMPFLTASPGGEVYLSWIDPAGEERHALRYSKWTGAGWSAPETISEGKNWFVNWADFPALTVGADGSMMAHWLARGDSGGRYGYGIRVARKAGTPGAQWKQVAAFREQDAVDYSGFLSFEGRSAVYLSPAAGGGQKGHGGHGEQEGQLKTLRLAEFDEAGGVARNIEIDGDVCSCCQTASAMTESGLLVAYRDHLPGEIRDISIIRIKNGKAGAPSVLHRDGWKIAGCPTEGPTVSSRGKFVAISWLTRAGDVARLRLARSVDGGATFGAPVTVDEGNPLGRPNLAALDESQSVLVWLERAAKGAEIRARRIFANGALGRSVVIAKVPASRSAGLPKAVVHDGKALVVWR